jgi:branched-chain amino acid transport system permease protein
VTAGETFNITVPLTVVLMSVLGGTRHWAGPAVGAVVITGLLYYFTAGNYPVAGRAAVGAILVVVILFMPNGILGFFFKARRKAPQAAAPVVVESSALASAPSAPATAPAARSGEVLLEVRELSKAFKGVQALDRVSLQVHRGEILGLLGPNGSGKSTFINVVSGHYQASGGQIVFEGRELAGLPAHRIAQAGIARTYQIPRPFAHLTVRQNVVLAAMFGGERVSQSTAQHEAAQWLEFTGLAGKGDALPDDPNLHQRKFLELARALASRPRLVLSLVDRTRGTQG